MFFLGSFAGVLQELAKGNISGNDVVGSVVQVAEVVDREMDGTSGALYSYVHQSYYHAAVEPMNPLAAYSSPP